MKLKRTEGSTQWVKSARAVAFLTLALAMSAAWAGAHAQVADSGKQESKAEARSYETLYLTGPVQRNTAMDIVTDLRNFLPRAKVFYVPEQNAISMLGTPDEFELARKMISDLNRARNTYRLTYTITESDGGQAATTRQVALLVGAGQTTELKEGNRVPVITGTTDAGNTTNTQVQYLDVGLNISASLDGTSDHLSLRTKVEQSGIAEEPSGTRTQDPVVSQTYIDDNLTLEQGKPVVLGSLDVPGSTRHMTIKVVSEPVS